MDISNEMRKILLAGVGAAAVTSEKAKELLDSLIEKGELTVEQGKILNEELKHKIFDGNENENLINRIDSMNEEDIAKIKAKIAELENKNAKPGEDE